MKNIKGYVNFVLHAHLPYVHHPECDTYLEEEWLFEAISETYVDKLGSMYKDTTSYITATNSVLSGSVRVRARNILFNNLFFLKGGK